MTENQVKEILDRIDDVEINVEVYERPQKTDWDLFRKTFGTDFGEAFVSFTNLMSTYNFPGEVFKIIEDTKNLNDSIYSVYKYESSYPEWDDDMLPIIGYGSGDHICLNISAGVDSRVYYFDHEINSFSKISESFTEWIINTNGSG